MQPDQAIDIRLVASYLGDTYEQGEKCAAFVVLCNNGRKATLCQGDVMQLLNGVVDTLADIICEESDSADEADQLATAVCETLIELIETKREE